MNKKNHDHQSFENLDNPILILKEWLEQYKKTSPKEPLAMSLATVDKKGQPSVRVVLAKEVTESSVIFYTNYNSHKGIDLLNNSKVGINFYFDPLGKQVRIQGEAQRTSRETSQAYWKTRARGSQISQSVSKQSHVVLSRQDMIQAYEDFEKTFEGKEIPCPDHWGGYEVEVQRIELWIGDPDRFHDRYLFEKTGTEWKYQRLSP